MAIRCFFRIGDLAKSTDLYVEQTVEFQFHNGFSAEQKSRSIESMHRAIGAISTGSQILEVSSKSSSQLGVSLSAFNLKLHYKSIPTSVESAFQGSKVFQDSGPYRDLISMQPWESKRDSRLKSSGLAIGYSDQFDNFYPLGKDSSFYDMVYLTALVSNPALLEKLSDYEIFTDIEFSKTKLGIQKNRSFNTQARSCAIASTIYRHSGLLGIQKQIDAWRANTSNLKEDPTLF